MFELRDTVVSLYREFIKGFVTISNDHAKDIKERVEKAFGDESKWCPSPIIQVTPSFKKAGSIEKLIDSEVLDQRVKQAFKKTNKLIDLYMHQYKAIEQTVKFKKNIVLVSGTGSGKSLCYWIPIVDYILKNNIPNGECCAVIVYPMNALVNSQHEEITNFLNNSPELKQLIKIEKYTGQETSLEYRQKMQTNPPQIILTNYMMMEYLLIRPDDTKIISPNLKFLVFDEIHQYRGRSGADISMLIRRIRHKAGKLTNEKNDIIHIGTSATLLPPEGSKSAPEEVVQSFASELFGIKKETISVITEEVEKITTSEWTQDTLKKIINTGQQPPSTENEFRSNPLVSWIEDNIGITKRNGVLERAKPKAIDKLSLGLHQLTGVERFKCENLLKNYMLKGSLVKLSESEDRSVFPIRIHQFVSQLHDVTADIDLPYKREISLNGSARTIDPQKPNRPMFGVIFCRKCGLDIYRCFRTSKDQLLPAPDFDELEIDDESTEEEAEEEKSTNKQGYLVLDSDKSIWPDDNNKIPEEFANKKGFELSKYLTVTAVSYNEDEKKYELISGEKSIRCLWISKLFKFCPSCQTVYEDRTSEYKKLAGLATEGRTMATTMIALLTLLNSSVDKKSRKILSFSDDRQDAAFQAGHFNDFVRTARIRAALLDTLIKKNNIAATNIETELFNSLSLDEEDFAVQPAGSGARSQKNCEVFKELLRYYAFEDLRRSWRIVMPNLEDLGILNIKFNDIDEIASNDEVWNELPQIKLIDKSMRAQFINELLERMVKVFAIEDHTLDLSNRMRFFKNELEPYIKEEWRVGRENELRYSSGILLQQIKNKYHYISTARGSKIHKIIKKYTAVSNIDEYYTLRNKLFTILYKANFVNIKEEKISHERVPVVYLNPDAITWSLNEKGNSDSAVNANKFYITLYKLLSNKTKTFVAKDHTAQVEYDDRQERENMFREGDINLLCCSPTMELGIDIGELSLVQMRNAPPTPANYAQRSGRAGRKGQSSLIFTFCSVFSPHDKYVSNDPEKFVSGAIDVPRFDLWNEYLIKSHIHSLWMTSFRIGLGNKIPEFIDHQKTDLPFKENVNNQLEYFENSVEKKTENFNTFFRTSRELLDSLPEPSSGHVTWNIPEWLPNTVSNCAKEFINSFESWKSLFKELKQKQSELSTKLIKVYGKEREEIERELKRVGIMLDLLLGEKLTHGGTQDFEYYPYRYLATEAFLPGYNFPVLPLKVFLDKLDKEVGLSVISRSRFIAIREFGPYNTLYHNGAKHQVKRMYTRPGAESGVITTSWKICDVCHYAAGKDSDNCLNCGSSLTNGKYDTLNNLVELSNVRALRRDKITCEEQERVRRGYQIETYFSFRDTAITNEDFSVISVISGTELLKIQFYSTADVMLVNKKWTVSDEEGYILEKTNREWSSKRDLKEATNNGKEGNYLLGVKPYVSVKSNVGLITLMTNSKRQEELATTFMHAFKMGLVRQFKLGDNEIGCDRLKKDKLLFWENVEGGTGGLRRVSFFAKDFRNFIKAIQEICHFSASNTKCSTGCYECLFTYFNQRDHHVMDRHLIKNFLEQLASADIVPFSKEQDYASHYSYLLSNIDPNSPLEKQFLEELFKTYRRLPVEAQHGVGIAKADFFYRPNILVFCDGSVHDNEDQKQKDTKLRSKLRQDGYKVITIRHDADIESQFNEYRWLFGDAGKIIK
ncbi:MAG: DEAD/DEAH box helicase [Planctomycetes bacterium]|nr:DEAD/DEAH box helicase [Planctomycetota bacterium]